MNQISAATSTPGGIQENQVCLVNFTKKLTLYVKYRSSSYSLTYNEIILFNLQRPNISCKQETVWAFKASQWWCFCKVALIWLRLIIYLFFLIKICLQYDSAGFRFKGSELCKHVIDKLEEREKRNCRTSARFTITVLNVVGISRHSLVDVFQQAGIWTDTWFCLDSVSLLFTSSFHPTSPRVHPQLHSKEPPSKTSESLTRLIANQGRSSPYVNLQVCHCGQWRK